ncbi:MAG: NAD-dependent epimerase/dehydratase family protein [Chitinophagaceae bacterium]|nr:NAD-dependent epimerase/dehydratase family protein [Oligoflexus sp.]
MRVLITGAAGFLGSHIVDRCLNQGDNARVIVRKSSDLSYLKTLGDKIEYSFGDLTDRLAVAKAASDIDVIYHSAGRVTDFGSYDDFFSANVLATRNLLEAARENGVGRFVFVSSPSIFADRQDHLNMDETAPYPKRFANYYAETKAISEQEVLAANSPSLITCSLRPRGVWGPRDKSGFLPKLLASMAKGKLKNLAPGKKVQASICHVQNIADACLAAAASAHVGGQAYFITDRETIVLWEFLDELAEYFGIPKVEGAINPKVLKILIEVIEAVWTLPNLKAKRSPPISRYAAGLLIQDGTFSIDKAKQDFGYDPSISQKKGLADLKAWIESTGGLQDFLRHVS